MRISKQICKSAWILIALVFASCVSAGKRPAAVPNGQLGQCGKFGDLGIRSANPSWRRQDRDLNDDRAAEFVAADQNRCSGANCYWNVFSVGDGCPDKFLGTIAGEMVDHTQSQGESHFADLRAWWRLRHDRWLVQDYRFSAGAYRVVDAQLCHKIDDLLECAHERPRL